MLTLIWCPFQPCVTAVARKRPWSFCQRCGGRLQLNRHTLLTQRSRSGLTMLSRRSVGINQGNELTYNSSGNTLPQSSQLAEPVWARWGKWWNLPSKCAQWGKKSHATKSHVVQVICDSHSPRPICCCSSCLFRLFALCAPCVGLRQFLFSRTSQPLQPMPCEVTCGTLQIKWF